MASYEASQPIILVPKGVDVELAVELLAALSQAIESGKMYDITIRGGRQSKQGYPYPPLVVSSKIERRPS